MQRPERTLRTVAQNKKAHHDYFVLTTIEAGIVLTGTEVKSIRSAKVNLKDSYASFPDKKSDEIYVYNMHISAYEFGNRENHEPTRPRKLLVSKREAGKLRQAVQEKGLTIVPLSLYFSGPYVKVELAVVKGKRQYDKRADFLEEEARRSMRRRVDEQ